MDQITKSLLEDFIKNNQLPQKEEALSKNFEFFCIHSIISNLHKDSFNFDNISMGDSQGIDGIAIIVNGNLVTSTKEIEDLIFVNKYLDVDFIFIQAKTTSKFEGKEIINFADSVKDFFSNSPDYNETQEILRAIELKNKIFQNSPSMKRRNPNCKLYYVTTGNWTNTANLKSKINNKEKELKKLSLFNEVYIIPCGASEIQDYYRKIQNATECNFKFDKRISLPVEEFVKESYFGVVSFDEFLKILTDERGDIKNVFYENVRDFLGESVRVNAEMEKSFRDGDTEIFCLMNNGITIVSEKSRLSGDNFLLENYQIVNGCQTSHVLLNNKSLPEMNKIFIPLKLIITDNEDIQNKIIVATNSQTGISKEQLEAFSKYQKKLELYYSSLNKEGKGLYYERRVKQHRNKDIPVSRIVTIRDQIKNYASMFLDQPHLASGYFSKVFKSNEDDIFNENDKFMPYYISSLTMYKLEQAFKNLRLDRKYRIARYHILMIFRILATADRHIPESNSKEMESYCDQLNIILLNDKQNIGLFKKSLGVLDSIPDIDLADQSTLYKANVEKIKEKARDSLLKV